MLHKKNTHLGKSQKTKKSPKMTSILLEYLAFMTRYKHTNSKKEKNIKIKKNTKIKYMAKYFIGIKT